ncbi:hypothetical protein ACET3Z_008731 [Daucus carota]
MEEYGVRESWIKKFAIDVKFYCGLRIEDLQKPINYLNNEELLFLFRFISLVSYSPQKGTFRDIKSLDNGRAEAISHVSSFISLKTHVFKRGIKYIRKDQAGKPKASAECIVDDNSLDVYNYSVDVPEEILVDTLVQQVSLLLPAVSLDMNKADFQSPTKDNIE